MGICFNISRFLLQSHETQPKAKNISILLNSFKQKISGKFRGRKYKRTDNTNKNNLFLFESKKGIMTNIHHNAQTNQVK